MNAYKIFVLSCFLILFGVFSIRASTLEDLGTSKVEYKSAISDFSKKFNVPNETKLELLRGGMSSSSVYKLTLRNKSFVVRLLSYKTSTENRLSEFNMHEIFAKKDLAPQILFIDNKDDPHLMVMEYIEGRIFNPKIDISDDKIMGKILCGLKHVHKSRGVELYNDTMMDFIKISVEALKAKKAVLPSKFFIWYEQLIQEYKKYKSNNVPIHGDLAPGNMIIAKNGKVYFIDFQEARMDSIFAEFSYFFYESGIDDREIINSVLKKYFNREINSFELNSVFFYMKATAFLSGMFRFPWIDKCYTVKNLDKILENLEEVGIDYFKKGDYDKIELEGMDSKKRVNYVLSFFKDYENMKVE